MNRTRPERRRHVRWAVKGLVSGRIEFTDSVSPLDLSLGGAQIEHSEILRPGTTMFLTLFFPDHQMTLKCAVIRSVVYGSVIQDNGERELIYRSGLEFVGISEDDRRVIGAYMSTAGAVEKSGPVLRGLPKGSPTSHVLAVDPFRNT